MKRIALFCILLIASPLFAQNYDESKVPHYTLPDVLKTTAGKTIRNEEKWEKLRRPEVLKLFEDHIYGQMPADYDSISYALTEDDRPEMDGKAVLKQVGVTVFRKGKSVLINVVLFIPTKARKPVPVFLLINNRGKENTDPTRAKKSEFWPAEMVVDSGFAIAAFHVSDLAPDNKDTYMTGILQKLYPEQLTKDNGMKAIGAWAWGASRVMDYFETDKDIDSKRLSSLAIRGAGKRRYGPLRRISALPRALPIAREIPGRHWRADSLASGSAGSMPLSRIGLIIITRNTTTKENALPVDQHMLIALIAPRPVYATNASKDLWADPKGTFLALKAAEPVYALYGIQSGLPKDPPGIDKPVMSRYFGYHNREGEHNMTAYDWGNFIRFAKGF